MHPAVAEIPRPRRDHGSFIEGVDRRENGVRLFQEIFRCEVHQRRIKTPSYVFGRLLRWKHKALDGR